MFRVAFGGQTFRTKLQSVPAARQTNSSPVAVADSSGIHDISSGETVAAAPDDSSSPSSNHGQEFTPSVSKPAVSQFTPGFTPQAGFKSSTQLILIISVSNSLRRHLSVTKVLTAI